MDDVLLAAIQITNKTRVLWPGKKEPGQFKMEEQIASFSADGHKYYHVADAEPVQTANSTSVIDLAVEKKLFVLPATNQLVAIAKAAGFEENKDLYVPFTHGDIPFDDQEQWILLMESAAEDNIKQFSFFCSKWSKKHDIGNIDLKNCFKVPAEGIEVIYPSNNKPSLLTPTFGLNEMRKVINETVTKYLGKYSVNSDGTRTAFIAPNGAMYISKGTGIIKTLLAANFKKCDDIPVFYLSGSEQITDPELAAEWEAIPYI